MTLHPNRPVSIPGPSQPVPRRSSQSTDQHFQNRFSSRSNSHTSLLGPVLEDETDQSCGSLPARRVIRPNSGSASMSRGNSVEEMGEWMVDTAAVQGGRERWLQRGRVILVLGESPQVSLEPLLANPSFANSLVITTSPPYAAKSYPAVHALSSVDLEAAVSEATSVSAAFRKKHKAKGSTSGSSSSPFDAILHFLPTPLHYDPTMALQRMLREAIMATTVSTASLASYTHSTRIPKRAKGDTSPSSPDMPIPLIHVIPAGSPSALPLVIERYLLQLLPTLTAEATSRAIRPLVLPSTVWQTRSSTSIPQLSAIEPILFGGLDPVPGTAKVHVSSWDRVVPSTSILALPVDPSWSYGSDMYRRGSSTSSTSSFGQHEVITPQSRSADDVTETTKTASLPPSRLSFVETFEEEDVGVEEGETTGKKPSRGVFGWMKRKT